MSIPQPHLPRGQVSDSHIHLLGEEGQLNEIILSSVFYR